MNLDELRNKIDALDTRVIETLNERARAAQAIGDLKRTAQSPIYVPEREKAVFKKLSKCNDGPLDDKAVQSIYREIISAIRALEKSTSIAFLGPRDTFSHMAALHIFGAAAEYLPLPSFPDVFTEVERKRIDYGVVPVESSMGGSVSDTLDRFITSHLKIVNEMLLHITQNLMANCTLQDVQCIYSKDNALLQCRNWLRANLPNVELIATSSTAEAARRAAKEPNAAAIASKLAAQTYGLDILAERIEDAPHNYTRFVVIGNQMVKRTGDDKTSILVWVKDKPGALYDMLLPFSKRNINLTRIESRPSQQKAWEYVFFIDFLGHTDDDAVKEVLAEAGEFVRNIKVLGSFPRAEFQE